MQHSAWMATNSQSIAISRCTHSNPIEAHPITADRWPDLETLFGPKGAYAGCWCMFWRMPPRECNHNNGEGTKVALWELVCENNVPSFLAYQDGQPLVLLFGRLFSLIPTPALAGLLIAVGVQSLRPAALRLVWETNLASRIAMGLTLAATLIIPLQYAIFVGIAVSIMLHVLQSSSLVRLVEVVPVEHGYPIEQGAPARLKSDSVILLMPYGDLFFAAASNLETILPDVGEAERAAVVLTLRGYEEVGSTFIGVLRRYAESLQARKCRLYLAGVSPRLMDQLRRTGLYRLIGPERVIPAAPQIGTAANVALADAYAWLEKPAAPQL